MGILSLWGFTKKQSIHDFVNRFQCENKLTTAQTNYLSSMIHLYITLKKFTHEDIVLSVEPYTHIKTIRGLFFNPETNEFTHEYRGCVEAGFELIEDEDE